MTTTPDDMRALDVAALVALACSDPDDHAAASEWVQHDNAAAEVECRLRERDEAIAVVRAVRAASVELEEMNLVAGVIEALGDVKEWELPGDTKTPRER